MQSQPRPMHVAQKCARFWDNDMHQIKHVAQKCARFWDNDMHQILHVAQKCVRFWENDMHPIKPLEFSTCEAIFCARR
ncbi:hypothetical protein ELI38_04885 [Rhizobium leguminosarum]|nr:hypothetical protein [Rhizobium leguminosarum bv. viciae]TAU19862.1 hypothetical protein ELI50_04400 [Rhizobium leguminosarum]TAU39867.1 hypothetical protein ELI51_05140 [Rhizobium leguminosarum]TAU95362.1 hypothetical protein ELI38_04885 [Rhizobium leguminosarum]TAV09780.1 hypothetical protein ELI37_04260 [Rhizobium leguminosarum]